MARRNFIAWFLLLVLPACASWEKLGTEFTNQEIATNAMLSYEFPHDCQTIVAWVVEDLNKRSSTSDLSAPVKYFSSIENTIEIHGNGEVYQIQKIDDTHTSLHIFDRRREEEQARLPRMYHLEYEFLRHFDPEESHRMEVALQTEYPRFQPPGWSHR